MGVVHHTTAGDPHKDRCCSVFGCGRILTPQEQLFGNKCLNHSIKYNDTQHDSRTTHIP